jgi:hypothetical protein
MFNRRTFLSLAAGGITAPRLASAQQASQKVALYANMGADLTHYEVDVASAELIKRETVTATCCGKVRGQMVEISSLAGEPMNTHDRDARIRWTAVRVCH